MYKHRSGAEKRKKKKECLEMVAKLPKLNTFFEVKNLSESENNAG